MLQPLEKRIFITLQQVKAEGIEELGLIGEDIKDGYARKIMSSMNKTLGKGSVYRELGIWYLIPEHWNTSPIDLRDNILWSEIKGMKNIIKWTIPISILSLTIATILLVLMLTI